MKAALYKNTRVVEIEEIKKPEIVSPAKKTIHIFVLI